MPSAAKHQKSDEGLRHYRVPPLGSIVRIDDFEAVAQNSLTPSGWAYYASGADDERSKADNQRAFQKLSFRPRCLRDVGKIDMTTRILGNATTMPIYISSTGLGQFAHPDAECALARAAGKEGIGQLVPMSPSQPVEAIVESRSPKDRLIFQQLYVNRDRQKAEAFIRKAEKLGFSSLWITVDSPVLGKRERDDKLKVQTDGSGNGDTNGSLPSNAEASGVAKTATAGVLNPTLTWDDLAWIRTVTSLPLVLKGVQCVEDAVLAYEHGVQGIVLSNHGGRSQDTAQPPMVTLLEINQCASHIVGRKMEILIDGGVRRGTDVIKALALGATAVGVGRPCAYSMTGDYGEAGVRRLIQILRAEIETNMALVGAPCINDLVPQMINTKKLERDVECSLAKF